MNERRIASGQSSRQNVGNRLRDAGQSRNLGLGLGLGLDLDLDLDLDLGCVSDSNKAK